MRAYPHHLTTDLPVLPVPRLDESLERYRKSAAAMLDAADEAAVNQAISDFAIGQAPALQQTLEEYAESTAASGSNWVAEQWLETSLANREPLLLTSNVTYQLQLPTRTTGVERVVELLQRIGSVHIQQAKRATDEEHDAHGRRLSMDGWATFNGGIRHPAPDIDAWVRAGTGATYRTIGVLHLGRMWEVPLTGSEAKLLDAQQLRASIELILAQTQPAESSFASFSTLGSGVLADAAPWQNDENRSVLTRLTNMLFTITLDHYAQDDADTLLRWAFYPGNAWVYKPISYHMSLDTNMLTANVEHSVLEAGTLATAVSRMQQVDTGSLETQTDAQVATATELHWTRSAFNLTDYTAKASTLRTERIVVRRDQHLPYAMNNDALTHLVLMIAQQLTFGRIRPHHVGFDMRHFRAGRTDVLRPVTVEAVGFVANLMYQKASERQLHAALIAHDDWVEAADSGKVFDQHFSMLRYIGSELGGANAPLFTENTAALEDFLTVTNSGTTDPITRALAAPKVSDGFHVHYTPVPAGTEFFVTWVDGTPEAEEFYRNLKPAADMLYDFIAGIDPIH